MSHAMKIMLLFTLGTAFAAGMILWLPDHQWGRPEPCLIEGTDDNEFLAKYPWLASATLAQEVTKHSSIPHASSFLKKAQFFELTMLARGESETAIKLDGNQFEIMQLTQTPYQQNFAFWIDTDPNQFRSANRWIERHPQPLEKLIVTQTDWRLLSGDQVKDRGKVEKYKPKACPQQLVKEMKATIGHVTVGGPQ